MTEWLEVGSGQRVLETGTNTGYQTALLAELAAEVYTVEYSRERCLRCRRSFALSNLRGLPQESPYGSGVSLP